MLRYLLIIGIVFGLTGFAIVAYRLKFEHKRTLLIVFAILLMSMLVFDTYLTGLPIVLYNSNSILGLKLGTIPIEDFGYLIVVVVLAPALFEIFSDEKKD